MIRWMRVDSDPKFHIAVRTHLGVTPLMLCGARAHVEFRFASRVTLADQCRECMKAYEEKPGA